MHFFFQKMSWLLLCIFSVVQVSTGEEHIKSKYISTNLDAKWNQTPLIHEAAEYLSEENSEYFWDFVDQTCTTNVDPGELPMCAISMHDKIYREFGHLSYSFTSSIQKTR